MKMIGLLLLLSVPAFADQGSDSFVAGFANSLSRAVDAQSGIPPEPPYQQYYQVPGFWVPDTPAQRERNLILQEQLTVERERLRLEQSEHRSHVWANVGN